MWQPKDPSWWKINTSEQQKHMILEKSFSNKGQERSIHHLGVSWDHQAIYPSYQLVLGGWLKCSAVTYYFLSSVTRKDFYCLVERSFYCHVSFFYPRVTGVSGVHISENIHNISQLSEHHQGSFKEIEAHIIGHNHIVGFQGHLSTCQSLLIKISDLHISNSYIKHYVTA